MLHFTVSVLCEFRCYRTPACVLTAVYENCMKLHAIVPILSLFLWVLTAGIVSSTSRLVFMFCKTLKRLIMNPEKDLKRERLPED